MWLLRVHLRILLQYCYTYCFTFVNVYVPEVHEMVTVYRIFKTDTYVYARNRMYAIKLHLYVYGY